MLMRRRLVGGWLMGSCIVACWGFAPGARAVDDVPVAEGAAIEEVDVTAEAPGPQLWKVSRDGHEVWILGTLQPLPADLKWRSREVERVLDRSQELILGGVNLGADIGPITAVKLYLQWRKVRLNADNQTLDLILPPAVLARLHAARDHYDHGDGELDRYQPMFAGARLFQRAMRAARLSSDESVQKTVTKLAKKRHLSIERIKLEVDDPKGLLTLVAETPQRAQIACLQTTLAHLETDVGSAKQRADAWATGDVDALRALPQFNEDAACWALVSNAPRIRALADQARASWIAAVRSALERNSSTLALQSIDRLLGPDGLLETLKTQGFRVEGP